MNYIVICTKPPTLKSCIKFPSNPKYFKTFSCQISNKHLFYEKKPKGTIFSTLN